MFFDYPTISIVIDSDFVSLDTLDIEVVDFDSETLDLIDVE